jgi:mRNA interferase MazF
MKPYIPRKDDFVAVTFDPQSGHEQRGRRPVLVVSNTLFNEHTGLAISPQSVGVGSASPQH